MTRRTAPGLIWRPSCKSPPSTPNGIAEELGSLLRAIMVAAATDIFSFERGEVAQEMNTVWRR
jgi:hypothetical protein